MTNTTTSSSARQSTPIHSIRRDLEGAIYVFYGSDPGPSTEPDWLIDSDQAGAWLGWSVSAAGDVNHDGYDDLIVGAPRYVNPETGVREGAVLSLPRRRAATCRLCLDRVWGAGIRPVRRCGGGRWRRQWGWSPGRGGQRAGIRQAVRWRWWARPLPSAGMVRALTATPAGWRFGGQLGVEWGYGPRSGALATSTPMAMTT